MSRACARESPIICTETTTDCALRPVSARSVATRSVASASTATGATPGRATRSARIDTDDSVPGSDQRVKGPPVITDGGAAPGISGAIRAEISASTRDADTASTV